MRNVISAIVTFDEDTNTTRMNMQCYEMIDAMEDTLVLRLYPSDQLILNSTVFLHKIQGDSDWTTESVYYTDDRVFEWTFDLSGIDVNHKWLECAVMQHGYESTGVFHVTFSDYAPTGILLINQWQRKMLIDLESSYSTGTCYFACYLTAALAIPESATAGDGLTVNEDNELTVELGDGLEYDEDGKIKVKDAKQVDSIAVTANSSGNVTSVGITYDDGSVSTYACTYDANDRLVSFGGVPITWS